MSQVNRINNHYPVIDSSFNFLLYKKTLHPHFHLKTRQIQTYISHFLTNSKLKRYMMKKVTRTNL